MKPKGKDEFSTFSKLLVEKLSVHEVGFRKTLEYKADINLASGEYLANVSYLLHL
jgi:hypothetical protein